MEMNAFSKNEIVWIHAQRQLPIEKFGRKSTNLQKALQLNFKVPTAFCISAKLSDRIARSSEKSQYHRILSSYVRKVLEESGSHKLVVRSSSIFEDLPGSLFSGLFDTYLNLSTTEEVIFAIEKIVNNAHQKALMPYFERVGKDPNTKHMAISVQAQIEPEISGIALLKPNTAYVEAVPGHLEGLISGEQSGFSFTVDLMSGAIAQKKKLNFPAQTFKLLAGELKSSNHLMLFKAFKSPTLEFAVLKGHLYVLQLKENEQQTVLNANHAVDATFFGSSIEDSGAKARAMRIFSESGLFTLPNLLIEIGTPISEIESRLTKFFENVRLATVRFSSGTDIGLPREFVSSKQDALRFIQSHHKKHYSIIIHEYIDVIRSFEFLIDSEFCMIEHIPGMWESNNSLQPDVIISSNGYFKGFRYTKRRQPVFDAKTIYMDDASSPLTVEKMEKFAKKMLHVRDVMIDRFSRTLPINVHAVWDSKTNALQCLNIRKGFKLPDYLKNVDGFHQVNKPSDLRNWDGSSPIRLALRTNRGNEYGLIELAKRLSTCPQPIVVDFGLLSHPAMVLREFGNELVPSYMIPGCFKGDVYERIDLNVLDDDIGPIPRIMREAVCLESDSYHIVKDRDPISANHFLAVSKTQSASTKDTDNVDHVVEIFSKITADRPGFYFERGRASFCTSGFSHPYDHFHIVIGLNNPRTFENLFRSLFGEIYPDISSAYQNVPEFGEYFVFGSAETGFAVTATKAAEKQIFRKNAEK